MTALSHGDFEAFFSAVHGFGPFPWQARLVARVCDAGKTSNEGEEDSAGAWPSCIALPTAAGKTVCIDIAVFALACQAALAPEKRTAPRRIFFVVDRRVVVDQAYDHAKALAKRLDEAKNGVLHRVAAALREVGANHDRPLDVYALRGGMYRESAWCRSPLQPTVITSTVDQIGSRLLFRGYGVSDSSKPLHAALVGNDALILLDEAHCARPFDQTMTLVRKYRGWTSKPEDRLLLPFQFVTMTATPGSDVAETEIVRLGRADIEHPVLGKRIGASKPASLVIADKARGPKWRDGLVTELVDQATRLKARNAKAVGVIVNRVATARDVAARLRSDVGDAADIVLLTGRMRPVDRDAILKKLKPLFSNSSEPLTKPAFVVATQTLEVGADLDFHAIVTECASLDALRQRFGRLNRVAARDKAEAVIVVRADQTKPVDSEDEADPVYGNSLANTWRWLDKHAEDRPIDQPASAVDASMKPTQGRGKRGKRNTTAGASTPPSTSRIIDFGVAAIETRLSDPRTKPDNIASLNAPAPDAAVLLPAHLDMWCQTSPRPAPDPDPSYFLHGPQRGEPEIQVVFRADLGEDVNQWAEIVSLCSPSSSEALSVRLREFRRWLAGQDLDERSGDVEGELIADQRNDMHEGSAPETRRVLRWRGPDTPETTVIEAAGAVTPNDTYVIPITNDVQRTAAALLGDFPADAGGNPRITDAGDEAFLKSRDKAILRLRHDLYPALDTSFDTLDPDAMEDDDTAARVDEALAALKRQLQATPDDSLRRALDDVSAGLRRTIMPHPLGGVVIIGKHRLHQFDPAYVEPDDSWESSSERPYPLDQHGRDVSSLAQSNAKQCGVTTHSAALALAGHLHDAGKADPRFQAWLHGGNARRARMCGTLYAKSVVPSTSRREMTASRERAGYPAGGRHELASVRLAECDGALPADLNAAQRDLVLHLIAAHHGSCRPFAPVIDDRTSETFAYTCKPPGDDRERVLTFTPDDSISGHGLERLDSGIAERFWALTRRYGWWGLPYLEALLRLADWACSVPRKPANVPDRPDSRDRRASATSATQEIVS